MPRHKRTTEEECPNCFGCGFICGACLFPINACIENPKPECRDLDTEQMVPCEDCGATGVLQPEETFVQTQGAANA